MVRKRNGRRRPAIHIGVLAYADDIFRLAESIDDVECSLHRLENSAAKIGLTINYNKTMAMHLGQASVRHVRFANGNPVDSCDKFEYLGVPTLNAEMVFRSRLFKAWAAATKLRSIINSMANDAIKIGLCRSAVESILLYGLECLPLTSTLQDKLHIIFFFISKNFISAVCMLYRINSIHTCGIQEINFTVKQMRRIYKKLK